MPEKTTNRAPEIDQESIEAMKTADTAMGRDLDAIFSLIDGPDAKQQFNVEVVVLDHKWDNQSKHFQ